VDPNKEGRLPDAYDMSVAGSRSASVSAWGSGCVFCPPSPKNISRDVSPSREVGRIFSRNSSRNVSSESSRCVSPCRDRLWSTKTETGGGDRESRTAAHLRREAYKNVAKVEDNKTESSNGDQEYPTTQHPSEVRPIISVVYCASEERRRSSSARPSQGEIVLSGTSLGGDRDQDGEWTPGRHLLLSLFYNCFKSYPSHFHTINDVPPPPPHNPLSKNTIPYIYPPLCTLLAFWRLFFVIAILALTHHRIG
jgi:hypothetical protein